MSRTSIITFGIALGASLCINTTAHAFVGPEGSAEGSVSTSGIGAKAKADGGAKGKAKDKDKAKPKLRPRNHDLFLGAFGGVWLPNPEIELGDVDKVTDSYNRVAGSVGLRLGYYPIKHFGMEGELAALPAQYQGDSAFAYTARIHGVIQPGLWRVTPFALLGGGVLGVRSGDDVVGNETDPALHVGGGVKVLLTDRIQLRLDVRDVISPRQTDSLVPVHSPEALLGISVRFGVAPKPPPAEPPPPDRDGDGVPDAEDHCPFDAGDDGKGCPWTDGDCDGVTDNVDECPLDAGVEPSGCPPPDADGDGILDEVDECPNEAGDAPHGCPAKDSDGDGLLDRADKCPQEPETKNGFEDGDGCPDELPEEVAQFSGVIQGIFFDTGKATIKPTSEAVLDNAAKVLADYPELRLEIAGHTDDRGDHDKNVELSRQRAESVKAYLAGKGIGAERLSTRGAGPDEPMAENTTKAGRAKNRRIEFHLVQP